jgi:two-component system chemotaxis response regulator CheY
MAKALVIDDSGLARRTVRKVLEAAGHEVIEAEDGLRGLEQFYIERPAVVILDVTMKDMDGLEVLSRIREIDIFAKVIIVTADVQSSTREMAEAGGASGFVIKPVVANSLLEALENALKPEVA